MSKILVVDDEPAMLAAFEEILGGLEHEVVTARRAETALEQFQDAQFDLVILDVRLPGMSGLEALRRIKQDHPKVPIIVMTGYGTMSTAIEATKLGAFDYHLKPIEPDAMLATIERALEGVRLMRGKVAFGTEAATAARDAIVGRSPAMQEVYKAIGRVAQTEAGVLIRGESGTGKELVARAIYQHSLRADKPLIVVNCAAIPETLLESELFGHERGAFTGAVGERIGKFQQASEGSIFLDEIGDIPWAVQAKILRVLQDRSFQRLGGNQTIHSNARVLAATNRNLEKAISEGKFREDLFHRLNVFTIHIPPLRQRPGDIPELVDYFLDRFAGELRIEKPLLSEEAMDVFRSHSWPGNVRELEHCVQRLMISTGGHPIQAADLSPLLTHPDQETTCGLPAADEEVLRDLVRRHLSSAGAGDQAHERFLQKVETLLITEALFRTKGNQTYAARLLGLPRQTLFDKLQKYHLYGKGAPPDCEPG
jgi:nitrogen regulation protein NR(I)